MAGVLRSTSPRHWRARSALAFARQGASVSSCASGVEALENARGLNWPVSRNKFTPIPVSSRSQARSRIMWSRPPTLGGIDVLVNNVTASGLKDEEDGWAASIAVDLMAVVRTSRRLFRGSNDPDRPPSSTACGRSRTGHDLLRDDRRVIAAGALSLEGERQVAERFVTLFQLPPKVGRDA